MYAQSHAQHWAQEEIYTRSIPALLCWTLQIQWIHKNLQTLAWKSKNSDL